MLEDQSTAFCAFAGPDHGGPNRPALLEAARTLHAKRVVRELLAGASGRLPDTLVLALEQLPALATKERASVDRALSQLAGAALDGDASLIVSAVRAAVATSGAVAFDVELPEPVRLRWRNVITPPALAVRFDPAYEDELSIRLRSGKEVVLGASDPRAVAAPRTRFGSQLLDLMPAWALDAYAWVDGEHEPSPLETPLLLSQISEAGDYLASVAPEYLAWVEDVASEIQPIDGRDGLLRSRSTRLTPGRIALTFPGAPIVLAELLIHEASHQYLHQARELGPLDDGSDPKLYWSPAKRVERPIDRILIAFHAWANMSVFFERCLDRSMDRDGYAARNLPVLQRDLHVLKQSLDASPALTDIGRALWIPFRDRAPRGAALN